MSRLPSETLVGHGETLYLNRLSLRPGDVLLTRGTAKVSGWIARLSAGPFSHAAIVVNSALLFESDDIGVGYTSLPADLIEGRGEGIRLLTSLIGVQAAVVLRHPGLVTCDPQDIEADLIDALYPSLGLQYPNWEKLAYAFPAGPAIGFLGRLLLRFKDWQEQQKVWNPGPFCSQLVSAALAIVLPESQQLFRRNRPHETVSPNSLLKSNLRPVKDGVVLANKDAIINTKLLEQFRQHVPAPARESSTGSLVRSRVLAKMNSETADRLIEEQQKALTMLRDALSK